MWKGIMKMKDDKTREEILRKIENVNSRISSLENLKKELAGQLKYLSGGKTDLYNAGAQKGFQEGCVPTGVLTIERVRLFRELFRGREDVYSRLWVSKKTGKSGYSPVCKNEWAAEICRKPSIRCSACPNRELVPVDDEIIRGHLAGAHVIGVYPMLKDETCNFLAVDFDGEGWVDNAFSFKETCVKEGVPAYVERSRSGNGAHVWIFFDQNIPASLARRAGSVLITKTMSARFELPMNSYDRLFPNQDTLPKGGFGNLIALPIQKGAAEKGNSVFIDESCTPYADQWSFLSAVRKMLLPDVKRFEKESSSREEGFFTSAAPAKDDPPWLRLPSGRREYKPKIKDLPGKLNPVLADRIYIKSRGLPSALLSRIRQLASFQNPEFYRRQNMRLSTYATPRFICCSEIIDDYLVLPRGCLEDLLFMLDEYGIKSDIKDERTAGREVAFKFCGELDKAQESAAGKILKSDAGVLVAPPGTGKTVIAINAIAARKRSTLVLVHRKPLMEQWRAQLSIFLGVDSNDIGQIGAGKNESNGMLDTAMIQSMERKGAVDDRIIDYGFIVADECHHISAVSFERVLARARAKYVLGLTATPYRKDGHQPIIHMQCGPIRHEISKKGPAGGISRFIVVPRKTQFNLEWSEESNIYELWPELLNDQERNGMIVRDIAECVKEGRFPLILTERRAHLEILREQLSDKIGCLAVLHGGIKHEKRKELLEELSRASAGKGKAILATGSYIGEGFDNPELDTLFITMPVSFKGKVVQYAGRLHRDYKGKNDVRIYDYADEKIPVLSNMRRKRFRAYKAMGYETGGDDLWDKI